MTAHLDLTAANGVPFRFVLEPAETPRPNGGDATTVMTYDQRYPFTEHGQPTGARYYVSTLLEDEPRLRRYGLNLHGGVPDWTLDPTSTSQVLDWLKEQP